MADIREADRTDERALVQGMSDGLVRSRLLEPWPALSGHDDPPDHAPALVSPDWCRRLVEYAQVFADAVAKAGEREAGHGIAFLLIAVCMGCGTIIYFTLGFEPDWTPLLSILCLLAVTRVLARRHHLAAQMLTLVLAIQIGMVAGKSETERRATPMLGSDVATRLTGRVVALEYQDKGSWRITIDVLATERPRLRFSPARIRITARDIPASTVVGGGLQGFARLRVPSGPVRPGNYDFAFHAYFNGIGANGFFLGTPRTIAVPAPESPTAAMLEWIAMLRVHVAERIEEVLEGEDASVAAALIAGVRAGISEETNEDLRKAGLAHILSISGLHMALAAGVVMLTLRAAFALFPAFSARHPVKKYAAFLSLLSCAFYLAMSGADVAAQRSYVMIAVMLCALLLDRAAISMRNLAIAALLILLLSPHEILGPSFQMSFAATAALIAAYAWWSQRSTRKRAIAEERVGPVGGWLGRMFRPMAATAVTSLVAGLASGIFAAYHFNNTAPLGLIGNVLALPAISILVMPFAVFSLVLMPLGLDWLPLQVMGTGIGLVRVIAAFVAGWSPDGNPGAIPMTALLFWTIALVLVVVLTTRLRFLTLAFVFAGILAFIREPFPDIVIAEDAKLVGVRLPDGRLALNRGRASKFTLDNWLTAYLIDEIIEPPSSGKGKKQALQDGFACEDGLCAITLRDGRTLAYTADNAMQDIACTIGDVVVLAVSGKEVTCANNGKLVITRRDLALKGTLEIRLGEENTTIANRPVPPQAADAGEQSTSFDPLYRDRLTFAVDVPVRPWHLHRIHSRAARGLPDREYVRKAASARKPVSVQ